MCQKSQRIGIFSVMNRTMYCHPEAHDKPPGQETKAQEKSKSPKMNQRLSVQTSGIKMAYRPRL